MKDDDVKTTHCWRCGAPKNHEGLFSHYYAESIYQSLKDENYVLRKEIKRLNQELTRQKVDLGNHPQQMQRAAP